MTIWKIATNVGRIGKDEFRAELRLVPDSPWFSGHFPDYPVLPGIAQLHAVLECMEEISGERPKISGLQRVRFKQILQPGDRPVLIVKRNSDDNGSYSFKIMLDDKVACSGSLVAKFNSNLK
jgi:3-hydroxymyristoyl/3-hydroxydecanoyl-(acyl carrier protein) dehydratase